MAYSIREALTGCRRRYGFIEFYFSTLESSSQKKPDEALTKTPGKKNRAKTPSKTSR
jgi:hypothetical protein